MSLSVDHDALAAIASGLRAAGTGLDESGRGAPAAVTAGVAGPLLGDVLATVGEAMMRLTYEAHHIAGIVDEANAELARGDDAEAGAFAALGGGQQ
ncbi:hypothetical protein [Actinotalea fermentans]|uniref:Uncharacterized protein n=1 Tax=Actinotalea fermentans TaxID=43671 RepID=A0A511YSX3_9CELL|nr:hypothetical protein [Actinotalea fermentans]KGM16984.1 hypothetical protein N867_12275 [Actinotalea fermentans ATCC 43279 = JCM 9966 = DSM 3133]GEN78301.1 hypothetical protein AFE02nite_00350 [Actinotalea fermentans]